MTASATTNGLQVSCFVFLLFSGCTPEHPVSLPAGGSGQTSPTESAPLLVHPEFANWSQFPLGTTVVREKDVTGDQESLHVTTTLRLAEKSSDHVLVESQTSIRHAGQAVQENPPLEFRYAARFALPSGFQPEQYSLPSLKARQIGAEIIAFGDQKYSTTLFAWDEVNETGPMAVRYWRSDAVPGRLVRQTIHGQGHSSLEEVSTITQPSPGEESR